MLRAGGHPAVGAGDGDEGSATFRVCPADVVGTDVFVPHQERLETILALRGVQPCVKIIAVSGRSTGATGDYLAMAKQLGSQVALRMPFASERLLSVVESLLTDREDQGVRLVRPRDQCA